MILLQPEVPGGGVDLLEAVSHAHAVAKCVLVLLVGFSLVSWAVILRKMILLKRCKSVSVSFRNAFKRTNDWRAMANDTDQYRVSPLVGLFLAGFGEITYQLKAAGSAQAGKVTLKSMEALERALQRASVVEMGRLERSLGFLATTAAASPFIGLFGTVWGIIDAFRGIGMSGSANLATVAPGIAEALIATAVGLIAAIPALVAYNFFQGSLKQFQTELDDFSLEFISLSERNFT